MLNKGDRGWWRGVLLLAGLLVLVTSPAVALQTTTVQDTVYRADGKPAQGTVLLSWSAFTAADGSAVAAGNETLTIGANGTLTVALTPNAGATPAGSYYTAVFHLNDGTVQKEYWVVPQGGTTTLSAIRANVVPAAVAQTWSSQASINAALSAMQSSFLPLKGGAVSGPITLPGDPSAGLQAATKQYVDSRTSLPANAIPYQGSTGTGAVAATFDNIVAPFHSMAYVSSTVTYVSTLFNEGTAGAGLIGTSPATDVAGSTWMSASGTTAKGGIFVSGGGAQFGPANAGNNAIALLDTGKADYTWTLSSVHLNGSASGGFQIYVRANNPLSAAEVIQWNPGGLVAIQDATGGATTTFASAQTSGLSGDIVVTLRGQSITVNWFGTVISGTIPTSTNAGNTFIGFNPNGSLGNTNDWAMTVSSMNVVFSGPVPTAVACSGIVQSDGTCGTVAPNEGLATDASGHATHLPEVQYSTDSTGNTTIACQEDHDRGIFDARCSRVEKIDGNNTVVTIYTSPALALQETSNEANCWVARNHRAATINIPPGSFKVGLASEPSLTFGPGQHILGSPSGAVGVGGSSNEGGTVFNATYNNAYVVQVISPYTSICADGTTATNGMDGGDVENLQATGCAQGGCINAPGDSNTYGGGGPGQGGIFVGLAHGTGRNLRAAYTGGVGVNANGLDSEFWDLWSYSALTWYRYDRGMYNGAAYNPGADGIHGGVELNTGDGRFHSVETYGSFTAPGTSGTGASELGHVCGVTINGGNTTVDDVFEQIDEMGICRPYGGNRARITNIRAEGNAWASVFNGDSDTMFTLGTISQGCTNQASVTALGYCDDVVDASASGGTFVNLKVFDNPTLGTSYRTGFIAPGKGSFVGVDQANGDGFEKTYPYTSGEVGYYAQVPEMDAAFPNGGFTLSGTSPDVGHWHRIRMANASLTNITDVTNPVVGQALHVTLASANDVLVSQANGGAWATCTGQNIVGPVGTMTFTVFQHFTTHIIQEECNPLPASAVANAADKSSATPQAFNGAITAPQFGKVFQVDRAPSSCTVGGTNYTTQINCAFAIAGDWVNTNGQNAALAIGQGLYQNCQAIQLPNPSSNGSLSIVGQTYGSTAATGVTIQQSRAAGCNTTLPIISQAANTNNQTLFEQSIKGVTIDGNSLVPCMDVVGSRRSEYEVNCNNPAGDHGVQISGTSGTLGFEMRKSRIFVRTAAISGITYPTVTSTITSGSVSTWNVVSGGSFPAGTPVVAYIAPGSQCTTLPSTPTVQTSTSGSTETVTGLTGGASAGVGCTAVYVQVFEQPQVKHCIVINTTDSSYQDLVCGGATSDSGIQINHGANLIEHAHVYAHNPVQVEDHGGNVYSYLECDSAGGYCLSLQGPHTLIFGMTSFWNAQVYPGSGDIYLAAGQTGNAIYGHVCNGSQTAGGYNEITTASGPFNPNSLSAPPGLEMLGPNQLCDGSGNYHTNYSINEPWVFGGLNAGKFTIYSDGSSQPGISIGSGANTSNWLSISGRGTFAFDASSGNTIVGASLGKGLRFGVNASGWNNGIAGGITTAGAFYQTIGTAIASAATIAPSGAGIVHVTGTAAITTMTPPSGCTAAGFGCRITLWPDGAWTIAAGGNFSNASTAVVGRPMDCTYDPMPAKWGCSY